MKPVLIISMDAVGDREVDTLYGYPHFSAFAAQAAVVRGADSIFLSNTYPIHTSIATGLPQAAHGVLSNTEPFPARHPRWHFAEHYIQATTLWQAAAHKGLRTAAAMWPVTAYSRTIRYNIPEIMARPGQSQNWTSFWAGSKIAQTRGFLKYGHLLRGIQQPWRDNWAAACMADIIRRKRPALMLMHLTAYDSLCHEHGRDSAALAAAFRSLDDNLGLLLTAAGDEVSVLVFSDHAQLNVAQTALPNDLLVQAGLLDKKDGAFVAGPHNCFFACCGGSAFFYAGTLDADAVGRVQALAAAMPGFRRMLTADEMSRCGQDRVAAFGICAAPGWHFENAPSPEKATHGYPLDYDDYKVFYMARGADFAPGRICTGGSIQDITALAAQQLELALPGIGPVRRELYR